MKIYLARDSTSSISNPASTDEPVSEEEESSNTITPEVHAKFLKDLHRFREDVIYEFAAFDASIARIQFLRNANEKERQRYASEKVKIEATAKDVRENTARLKVRLDEAQRTLATRKQYDVLAEKITKEARLKPRDEQGVDIERLRVEIEELEKEGAELGSAWTDRREQFGRILEEGMRLRRVVRDEKEPELEDEKADGDGDEDRDEDRDGDGDGDEMLGVDGNHRDGGSNMGTPRPMDEDAPPTPLPGVHESGAMTPRSTLADAEVMTPRPENLGEDRQDTEMQEGETSEYVRNVPSVKISDEMDMS